MSNGSTSQTDAKLYIPGSIKTQMDLYVFGHTAKRAEQGRTGGALENHVMKAGLFCNYYYCFSLL